eukprot:GHRR01013667.1.p1 GENE.GHRR01013667.1~~GHRR01013667.1.p1  ORF type:complete len:213 (+),score=78.41 GHRR01013667.1:105-743(+)
MSLALRKIAANAAKSGCTIVFINQLRFKVGVIFGNPETTSGGNALKYYSTMRLDIRARDKITETGKAEPVGCRTRVKVIKNKVSPPHESAEFDIMYGDGINAAGCVFDVAKDLDVLEARGAHYYFEGNKLAHGRENVLTYLKENPDTMARLVVATKAKLAEHRSSSSSRSGTASRSSSSLPFDDDDDLDDLLEDDEALNADLMQRLDDIDDV